MEIIQNVIAALNKPTLIISHNKTLADQLYDEGQCKKMLENVFFGMIAARKGK